MHYRQLGTTGLQMTAFSLGTWQTFSETVDLKTADRIVSTAYDLGIRCFDGAEALALGWVLKNPNVSTAILGASAPEQIERNMGALDAVDKLTPRVVEQLEGILAE